MEKRELNRDYRRLAKRYLAYKRSTSSYKDVEWMQGELRRLHGADPGFTCSPNNLRIAVRINQSIGAIPLHTFASSIEI